MTALTEHSMKTIAGLGERTFPLKSALRLGERSLPTGLLIAIDWVKDRYRLGDKTFTPIGT